MNNRHSRGIFKENWGPTQKYWYSWKIQEPKSNYITSLPRGHCWWMRAASENLLILLFLTPFLRTLFLLLKSFVAIMIQPPHEPKSKLLEGVIKGIIYGTMIWLIKGNTRSSGNCSHA